MQERTATFDTSDDMVRIEVVAAVAGGSLKRQAVEVAEQPDSIVE